MLWCVYVLKKVTGQGVAKWNPLIEHCVEREDMKGMQIEDDRERKNLHNNFG